ncbi:MAG: DUF4388 domain-containing protein [Myxococcales bacterium]|nr:DUF4388 domain-containing protein [Myxococcales bacterium]
MEKILIVINNRGELRRISTFFEKEGFEVIPAADGLAGFDLFKEHLPAAIVIDVLIPKLSGGELCQRIKSDPDGDQIPIVIVSSLFRQTNMAERVLKLWKADRYYQSPYMPKALVEDVEKLIAARPPRERPSRPPATAAAPPETTSATNRPTPAHAAREPEISLDDLLDKTLADIAGTELLDRAPKVAQINEGIKPPSGADNPLADLLAEMTDLFEAKPPAAAAAEPLTEELPELAEVDAAESDEEFPREGLLEEISVPELMAYLYYSRKTGILELSHQGNYKHVYFDEGRAVYVESESRQESLGQVLMRQGIVSEQDVMLSLENMAAFGRRQGGAMVELGILNPMQLYQALRQQMREKLLNLFQWLEGSYYFDEVAFDKLSLTIFELPMPRLILDGVLHSYDAASVEEMFAEVGDQVVVPAEPLPFDRRMVELGEEIWRLHSLIDGRRTLAEIVAASPLEREQTFLLLYAMLILRMFDRRREEEEAPARPPQPASPPRPARTVVEPTFAEDVTVDLTEIDWQDPESEAPAPVDLKPIDESPAAPAATAGDDDLLFVFEDAPETTAPIPASPPPPSSELAPDLEAELAQFEQQEIKPSPAGELAPIDEVEADQSAVDDEWIQGLLNLFLRIEQSNHYELLDVPRNAGELAIKMAYHNLVKKYHADKIATLSDPELKDKANRVVQSLTLAYNVLANVAKRAEYDRRLSGMGEELKERRITTILAAERAFNQGVLSLRRGRFAEAETHFREACDLFPEEGEYHAFYGWACFNNSERPEGERSNQARESIERSIKINPKGDKGYFFLGKILLGFGNKEKARQMFALAFRYNKNNEEAKGELRKLQVDRERERVELEGKEKEKLGSLLKKDIDFSSVKRTIKKIFF